MTEPRRRRSNGRQVTPPVTPPVTPVVPEPPAPTSRFLPSGFSTIRDVLLFVIGVGIIGHEVFIQSTTEAAAIGVGVAMCGLPLVFGADDKRVKR